MQILSTNLLIVLHNLGNIDETEAGKSELVTDCPIILGYVCIGLCIVLVFNIENFHILYKAATRWYRKHLAIPIKGIFDSHYLQCLQRNTSSIRKRHTIKLFPDEFLLARILKSLKCLYCFRKGFRLCLRKHAQCYIEFLVILYLIKRLHLVFIYNKVCFNEI